MPTFKDVVNFLKDRVDVANHPFFSWPQSEPTPNVVYPNLKPRPAQRPRERPTSIRVTTLATSKQDDNHCPMCEKPHRLYRCEVFKSKSPRERNEFVKANRLCFNCLSSTGHNSKNCKCLTRCQASGCGKPHHSMLHFTNPSEGGTNSIKSPQSNSITTESTTTVDTQDIMLQVLPVKVISEQTAITTYCLIDSGSDVTLIDPSLAKELNIKGTPENLVLNIVSKQDDSNPATRVSFKLDSLDSDDSYIVKVETAWAVKELVIPIKQSRIIGRMLQ